MGDVVEFPQAAERVWSEMKAGLSDLIAPKEALEWVLDDFKPRFLSICGAIDFDTATEGEKKVAEKLIEFLRGKIDNAMLHMIILEIRLYFAIHGGEPGASFTLPQRPDWFKGVFRSDADQD